MGHSGDNKAQPQQIAATGLQPQCWQRPRCASRKLLTSHACTPPFPQSSILSESHAEPGASVRWRGRRGGGCDRGDVSPVLPAPCSAGAGHRHQQRQRRRVLAGAETDSGLYHFKFAVGGKVHMNSILPAPPLAYPNTKFHSGLS